MMKKIFTHLCGGYIRKTGNNLNVQVQLYKYDYNIMHNNAYDSMLIEKNRIQKM